MFKPIKIYGRDAVNYGKTSRLTEKCLTTFHKLDRFEK